MKLTKEQIMVAEGMITRGVSIRQMARQLGVRESGLRYRLRRRREGALDGRSGKPTALDSFEDAVHMVLERLDDVRITGVGRPAQARQVFEILRRDHGFTGSYRSVVRHIRRRYGLPAVRALRRVETPPGVQAQHDWFDVATTIGGERLSLPVLVGTLSHSRARFPWVSRTANQLAWHTGHLEMFRRYGGVPLWVRIDNLKTGVATGAGGSAVLNRSYELFAREVGFEVDPCRARMGQDKGKTERSVRTFRDHFGDLFSREWPQLEPLQSALDERAAALLVRLKGDAPRAGLPRHSFRSPGVGKSHLAVSLGVKAIKNGFSVTHFVLDDLMHALRADAAIPPARLKAKRYLNTAVLIVDEVGFRPLDRHEANLFFRLVSTRYEKGSIVLTSNKHVRDWPEIFAGDEILTTAILDRLLHHVHVVHIDGRSYRLRELDGLLQAPTPASSTPPEKGEIRKS